MINMIEIKVIHKVNMGIKVEVEVEVEVEAEKIEMEEEGKNCQVRKQTWEGLEIGVEMQEKIKDNMKKVNFPKNK